MNCATASPARYLHVLQLFTPTPTPALPSRAECCFSGNVLRSHFHNTKYKMLISGDCFRPPPQDGSWHLPDYDLKNVWLIKHGSYQRGFSREKSELIGAGAGGRPRPRQPATHLIVRTLILSSCPDLELWALRALRLHIIPTTTSTSRTQRRPPRQGPCDKSRQLNQID